MPINRPDDGDLDDGPKLRSAATHESNWEPGDPCHVCGSTQTWWTVDDGACCGNCGATDADE